MATVVGGIRVITAVHFSMHGRTCFWLLACAVAERLSLCINMTACCVFVLLTCRRAVLSLLTGLLTSVHVLAGRALRVGGAVRNQVLVQSPLACGLLPK